MSGVNMSCTVNVLKNEYDLVIRKKAQPVCAITPSRTTTINSGETAFDLKMQHVLLTLIKASALSTLQD